MEKRREERTGKERRGEEEGRGGVRGMERNSEERRRKERRSE